MSDTHSYDYGRMAIAAAFIVFILGSYVHARVRGLTWRDDRGEEWDGNRYTLRQRRDKERDG
jgi:hypothetical protein